MYPFKGITVIVMALVLGWLLAVPQAGANNLVVTNVSLGSGDASAITIEFDLSWDHSWHASWTDSSGTWTNWDAAWVFVKFNKWVDDEQVWEHASLGTNDTDHTVPAGAALDVGLTDGTNGVGVFIYRNTEGAGTFNLADVQLKWLYALDGVSNTSTVDISIHAIEMVYVPQGAFQLGDGASAQTFYEYDTPTTPYSVSSDSAITVGTTAGNLTAAGGNDSAYPQTLGLSYPRGYRAFYCMKYEISQGQYAAFLNELTALQASTLDDAVSMGNYATRGGTISGSHPGFSASEPDRACNGPGFSDIKAYADWAGLRPMTELEFEKACRGPLDPIGGEFAWGSNGIHSTAYTYDYAGTPTTVVNNASSDPTGNAIYSLTSGSGTPVRRCGIFAASFATPTRAEAGASYWGIMELSGNALESVATLANADVSGYSADSHGDGELSEAGAATNSDWPADNRCGLKGGGAAYIADFARVSDRTDNLIDYANGAQHENIGGRAVRSAP